MYMLVDCYRSASAGITLQRKIGPPTGPNFFKVHSLCIFSFSAGTKASHVMGKKAIRLTFPAFRHARAVCKMPHMIGLLLLGIAGLVEALPYSKDELDSTNSKLEWYSDNMEETTTLEHDHSLPPGPRKKDPAYIIVFGILACLLFIGAIVVLVRSWRKKKRRQKVTRKVAFRENPSAPPTSLPVRMDKVALALKMEDVVTPERTPEATPRPTRCTVKFATQTSVRFEDDSSVADQQEA